MAGGVAGVAGCVTRRVAFAVAGGLGTSRWGVARRVAFAVAGDLGTSRWGIEVQVQAAEITYRLTSTMSTTTHIFTSHQT